MPDYTFDAIVRLRVSADDFHEAAERAEEFFSVGLEQLAYSTDDEDDCYSIDRVHIDWGAARKW